MDTHGAVHPNKSLLYNLLDVTDIYKHNNSFKREEQTISKEVPEVTIAFQTDSLVFAVVCSSTSMAIIGLFLFCCCRALRTDGSYDCSCTYERPETQTSGNANTSDGSSTVISGSVSFRAQYKHYSFKPKAETIMEESEEGSGVHTKSTDQCVIHVQNMDTKQNAAVHAGRTVRLLTKDTDPIQSSGVHSEIPNADP